MDIQSAVNKCKKNALSERNPSTAKSYSYGIDLFCQSLQDDGIKLSDDTNALSTENFIEFPSWLSMKDYSKQSIRVYYSGANYLFEWLIIHKFIDPPDYAQTIRYKMAYRSVVRRRADPFVRFPKRGEAERMLDAVKVMNLPSPQKERDVAIVHFLYNTGCRNNEIIGLTLGDIDMKDRSAIVTGKGGKDRRVFFNEEAADLLREYWKARAFADDPTTPAFCRHDRGAGKKVLPLTTTSIRNIVRQVANVAGIDPGQFTPHYFRHAFAIKMLQDTNILALVQDLMGHANPASTRVYAKIYPEELKKAHEASYNA